MNITELSLNTMNKKRSIVAWVITIFLLTGCATAGKQDYLKVNTPQEKRLMDVETEIKFGHYVDAYIQNEYTVLDDSVLQQKLESILDKIVSNCDRNDLKFTLRILNSNDVNAFAGPGGYVYVTTGLLDSVKSKDELAGIFAHEVGHICARHAIKSFYGIETTKGILAMLSLGATLVTGDANFGNSVSDLGSMVAIISIQGYSRSDELQADSLAVKYSLKSEYNSLAMINLLERMEEKKEKERGEKTTYNILSSHPTNEIRAENIKKQLESLRKEGKDDQT